MNISRRFFLLGAGSLVGEGAGLFAAADKPLFTAGAMTDTHVLDRPGMHERVRRAYRLFRKFGVDLIINNGDICDKYCPEGYRRYRAISEETYPNRASCPKEVFVWANHDRVYFTPGLYASSYEDSFAAAKPLLGIRHEMYDQFEMGGYRFLVYPQCVEKDLARYEREIAAACKASPGKPVFVINHVPPARTTGFGGGSEAFRRILDRYPQVVNFCGHSHGSLRNPALIWQDGFTCINFGCLQTWAGQFLGRDPGRRESWDVSYLEFYADRLVVRRFSLKDGSEIESDDPWVVYWGGEQRYVKAKRAAAERAPQFAAGAEIRVAADDETAMKTVKVSLPPSDDSRRTLGYRLTIDRRTADGWSPVSVREICGDFYREEQEPAWSEFPDVMPAAFFDEGTRYRLTARPYGFFGAEGRAITREWTAPKRAATEVLCDLTEGLPTLRGGEKFDLPEAVQKLPRKTKLRLIVDAQSDCPEGLDLAFRMQCFPRKEIGSNWICCESGRVTRRYVLDFSRCSGKQPISLSPVFSPKATKLQLLRVRVERVGGNEADHDDI